MSSRTRREALAGLMTLAAAGAVGQGAERGSAPSAASGPVAAELAAGDFAAGCRVFALSSSRPVKQANGTERVAGFEGRLATGEALSMHESWAPPGLPPAPLHTIQHSELIVVLEGEVELVRDSGAEPARAGDVVYIAYGTHHAIRNHGASTARYMVLQMGGDAR